jgi:drug/metabolite transporter (DMT)-like permease
MSLIQPGVDHTARETRKGLVALLSVQFMFGLFPVVGKFAFVPGGFTPSALAFWRIAFGAVVLGALVLIRFGRGALPSPSELPLLFLLSLLSVALNQGFYLEGLERSSGTATGLVMCLIPVFTYGVAVILKQEVVRGARVAGIAIALAGTIPLLLARGGGGTGSTLGIAFLMTNALVYSIYLVLAKPVMRVRSPLFLVAWVYLLSIVALPWFGWRADLVPAFEGNEGAWLALAYTLLFPTVLAYLANAYALARVRASTTAFFIYMQPVITGVASWFVLGERLTPLLSLSAAGLVGGSWLVLRQR